MELRDYQQEFIKKIRESLKSHKRICCVLPTGAGKTVIFSQICRMVLEKNPCGRVLIFVDTEELMVQAAQKISKLGLTVYQLSANHKKNKVIPYAHCYVCMVQTFLRREYQDLLNSSSLIIIDEAHILRFAALFDMIDSSKIVLGFTATPISASKKNPMKKYYSDIVVGAQIPDLIEKQYLSRCRIFEVVDNISFKIDKKTGDFEEKEMMSFFDTPKIYSGVCENITLYANDDKIIIFCVNVEHAKKTYMELVENGFGERTKLVVASEMTKEIREDVINFYRNTKNGIIVNVNILTKGFDVEDINSVFVLRATTSVVLWLQMCGRGSRVSSEKQEFKIFDFGGNTKRLGRWDSYRDWEYLFFRKKNARVSLHAVSTKSCTNCGSLIHAKSLKCEACGYVFEKKEFKTGERVVLLETTNNAGFENKLHEISNDYLRAIVEKAHAKKYKVGWILHRIFEEGDKDMVDEMLKDFAKFKGYKPSWVYFIKKKYGYN